jgi:hypothetical protein
MLAVIQALTALGGSARPAAIYSWVQEKGLRRPQVPPPKVSAEVHYQREVRFARQELAEGGILVSDEGTWKFADFGVGREITVDEARNIVRENSRRRKERAHKNTADIAPTDKYPSEINFHNFHPTTGPRPSSWEGTIVRANGPAWTYVFKFGDTDLWKIGFAADVEARLGQVNQHVPVELLDGCWSLHNCTKWRNPDLAYAMEQKILLFLKDYRTMFERVRCNRETLERAWENALSALHHTKSMDGSDLK